MIEQGQADLGPIQSVYYVERPQSVASYIFSSILILGIAAGLVYIDIPVCGGIVLLILVPVTVDLIRGRRNLLELRENGLVYFDLFSKKSCRWDEVEEFGHIIDDGSIPPDDPRYARKTRGFRVWIVKYDGKKIEIRPDLARIHDAVRSMAIHIFGPEHVAEYASDYYGGTVKTTRTITEIDEPDEE